MAVKNHVRIRARHVVGAGEPGGEELTLQPLDEHLRDVPAAVGTDVDDKALFPNLTVEPLELAWDNVADNLPGKCCAFSWSAFIRLLASLKVFLVILIERPQ